MIHQTDLWISPIFFPAKDLMQNFQNMFYKAALGNMLWKNTFAEVKILASLLKWECFLCP